MPIALPDVLDAERPGAIANGGDGADAGTPPHVEKALRDACDYGRRLWMELDAARTYLYRVADGKAARLPTAEAWEEWGRRLIAVSSLLAGPHGDSGYGAAEAHRIALQHGVDLTVETGTATVHADFGHTPLN